MLFLIDAWFFGQEACGILASRPGIEPGPAAVGGEVLTNRLPGKSLQRILKVIPLFIYLILLTFYLLFILSFLFTCCAGS